MTTEHASSHQYPGGKYTGQLWLAYSYGCQAVADWEESGRLQEAIEWAEAEIDGAFGPSMYEVPLSPVTPAVRRWAARLAAWDLCGRPEKGELAADARAAREEMERYVVGVVRGEWQRKPWWRRLGGRPEEDSSMKSITQYLREPFEQAIRTALGVEADPQIVASTCDRFGFSEYRACAAISLARELSAVGRKTSPRTVAEQIVGKLQLGDIASWAKVEGPGFIGIGLRPSWLAARLAEARADKRLGVEPAERPLRVVLDYASLNVAKEKHVGHLRSTNIGDALARVIEFQGHELIRHESSGESFYNPMLPDIERELLEKRVAVESDGAVVVFVEGFEAPLIIRKRDGSFGYGAADLAALRYRTQELRARWLIYVTDARQIQHFAQVFDAARRAGWTDGVRLDHVLLGTILGPDGTPFKTKEGQRVKDLLEEAQKRALLLVQRKTAEGAPISAQERRAIAAAVGIGAIKYYDLARDSASDYVFDWAAMLSMDGNTALYLQSTYASIRAIIRRSGVESPPEDSAIVLQTRFEQALAKHILCLGEVIDLVLRELKPHHLCTYLYELARRFEAYHDHSPVIVDRVKRESMRNLNYLTGRTLELGLDLLGIEHPEWGIEYS